MAKILFVEPDNLLGKIYCKLLFKEGHNVRWEQDASSAIQAIDADLPDLVIIELQIALHNGLELIYEIRSYEEWQNLKILLNTNVAESKLKKSPVYKQLNISKYLYKPTITLDNMKAAVSSVLSK